MSSIRVLGIDPGYGRCGWGVISISGNIVKALGHGVIETDAGDVFSSRLLFINQQLKRIIIKYDPDEVAVEQIYFAKNAKTAIDVGQARGVILLTCAEAGKNIAEYKPLEIKQAVTGYGKADKKQVQHMVKVLLNLQKQPRLDDASDALAAALCHCNNRCVRQITGDRNKKT